MHVKVEDGDTTQAMPLLHNASCDRSIIKAAESLTLCWPCVVCAAC
jgi:hypothetical protein